MDLNDTIVTVDIGGTHARFALADVAEGRVVSLGEATTLRTADHASFETAWAAFAGARGPLPRQLVMAIAAPTHGDVIRFTNNPWTIRPGDLDAQLHLDRHLLVNDFEAVGHAVAQTDARHFDHLCGPDSPLPQSGVISVIGPGTGLGVSCLWRDGDAYRVQPTEGGHVDFAPLDAIEDALLARLRKRHRRVSTERIVSGPAIVDIYETLAAIESRAILPLDDRAIWERALGGEDVLAVAALDRFCLSLGSVAGDIALAQGASAVVIAGGLGLRIRDTLVRSGFPERFVAKGRFQNLMADMPVKLITHPQPGLFGAAAAFARCFA